MPRGKGDRKEKKKKDKKGKPPAKGAPKNTRRTTKSGQGKGAQGGAAKKQAFRKPAQSDPVVNLGKILKDFLSGPGRSKSVQITINEDGGRRVLLSCEPLAPTGVTFLPKVVQDLDTYLAEKRAYGQQKQNESALAGWIAFRMRLKMRVKLDLGELIPQVMGSAAKNCVHKFLSPFESELIKLSDENYAKLSEDKLAQALKPTEQSLAKAGGPEARVAALRSTFNGGAATNWEHPSWFTDGVFPLGRDLIPSLIDDKYKILKATADSEGKKTAENWADVVGADRRLPPNPDGDDEGEEEKKD